MPNGHDHSRQYGPHRYDGDHGTIDCAYGCGCSMGPSMSHGPLGLDPGGECPNNPLKCPSNPGGTRLSGKADYETVVERRIRALESRAHKAEVLLVAVEPGSVALAERLENVQGRYDALVGRIQELFSSVVQRGVL